MTFPRITWTFYAIERGNLSAFVVEDQTEAEEWAEQFQREGTPHRIDRVERDLASGRFECARDVTDDLLPWAEDPGDRAWSDRVADTLEHIAAE